MSPIGKLATAASLLSRHGLRRSYYSLHLKSGRLARAGSAFTRLALGELVQGVAGPIQPIRNETRERIDAVTDWICRAQDATPDHGVSYGFFPGRSGNGWMPSYPETTGYIIPTMLACASRLNRDDLRERALRMAEWEIDVQMRSGAVQGGMLTTPDKQTPAEFNTGMVLQGWTEAWRITQRSEFFDAARRAADYMLGVQQPDGSWANLSEFVAPGTKKSYNVLCSWAVYRFGEDSGERKYSDAAVRNVEALLREQQPNGWIANNCLENPLAPLTHTIGYAMQGALEVGVLSEREDFIAVARRMAEALMPLVDRRGYLPGRLNSDWTPAALSSCLTGQAQIAIVLYRLFQLTGRAAYRETADRLLNFVKATQRLRPPAAALEGVVGAVAGSWPLTGGYITLGYPNWAAKYFLDALLLQLDLETTG